LVHMLNYLHAWICYVEMSLGQVDSTTTLYPGYPE
jgi:hypothetical protein